MRKILVSFDNRRAITMSALLILTAAAFCTNVIAQNPAKAEPKGTMDVTFANITNATIKVTAKDLNADGKTIAYEEELKHNEQITRKMVADKDGNGHVSYSAHTTEADVKQRKCKSYEGRQLSNGHTFSITADRSC